MRVKQKPKSQKEIRPKKSDHGLTGKLRNFFRASNQFDAYNLLTGVIRVSIHSHREDGIHCVRPKGLN